MAGRRVIVCGGRDFADRAMMWAALDAAHAIEGFTEVIEGGAKGADAMAKEWATERGVKFHTVAANWAEGPAAGPKRNQRMLEMSPHMVIAFPGGRGTEDMTRRAEQAGVFVSYVTCLG